MRQMILRKIETSEYWPIENTWVDLTRFEILKIANKMVEVTVGVKKTQQKRMLSMTTNQMQLGYAKEEPENT